MDSLYRDQILDHWRSPHNFGELIDATHQAFLSNPLCGDEIEMKLRIANDRIEDIRFTGRGCAISIAATSMLIEELKNRKTEDVRAITSDHVIALLGTTPNPSRMKCAMLGLETLQRAMAEKSDP